MTEDGAETDTTKCGVAIIGECLSGNMPLLPPGDDESSTENKGYFGGGLKSRKFH